MRQCTQEKQSWFANCHRPNDSPGETIAVSTSSDKKIKSIPQIKEGCQALDKLGNWFCSQHKSSNIILFLFIGVAFYIYLYILK